jgi:hypothetical protein
MAATFFLKLGVVDLPVDLTVLEQLVVCSDAYCDSVIEHDDLIRETDG